jgi:solute carrier family 25 carnitine/acylcarnitine transporter 20/29
VDVVKTRAQLLENEKNPDYKSIVRGFKALYRSGGTRVFFSGLGATIVRAFPTNACTFYAYLWVKNYLEDADQRKA